MQHDAAHRAFDPHGHLEQPFPQRGHLRSSAVRAVGLLPQRLQQDIGRRRQQHPELIGPELRATCAVQRQPVMQFLEPVLHVPALAVDGVHRCWGLGKIGHHEARIAFGIPSRESDHFGVDEHAAAVRPALGRIERLPIDLLRAPLYLDRP